MTAPTRTSAYDQYADAYAAYVATREQDALEGDPFGILPPLLAQLGDVTGQEVLDAGCGEGYLARILAARGARVTGVGSPCVASTTGFGVTAAAACWMIASVAQMNRTYVHGTLAHIVGSDGSQRPRMALDAIRGQTVRG